MSHEVESSHKILKGAAILTAAALLVKILSAIYRVPFQNMAGDMGFYIYQQVYPIYGIAVVLATYGFPVGISKLLVESGEIKQGSNERKQIITASFIWISFVGVLLFLVLFFCAESIAGIMNDGQLAPLIRTVAFSFLLLPFISIGRGYYQANGNMIPTAVSQTFEQLFRVSVILIGTYLLVGYGSSLYMIGEGAIAGSLIGGVIASLVLLYYIWKDRHNHFPLIMPEGEIIKKTGKVLLFQGLAFCLNNMYLLLFQLLDSLQLFSTLIAEGIPADDAKVMKGIYDRGQPLIQVGLVVATSLSLSLVPVLTSLQRKKAVEEVKSMCWLAIKVSSVIGLGAALGLIGILKPVNIMLFKDNEGLETLAILAILILLASLLITCSTIMQTMGFWKPSVLIILSTIAMKGVLNPWLISEHGIKGAAYSSLLALIVACGLLLFFVVRYIIRRKLEFGHIAGLVIAGFVMYSMLKGYSVIFYSVFDDYGESRIWASMHALSSVAIGGAVYVFMLLKMKLFREDELTHLPGGHLLIEIMNNGINKR